MIDNGTDRRSDPHLGTVVHVVHSRQNRPNLPSTGCPFCVGGLEAPNPYDVFAFKNRWPAMPGERCEVVLYTSEHDATFAELGPLGARKVIDLWAERTAALGARDDVDFVLVFENRGPEVGATIAHPHGQIYAYDHVPARPAKLFAAGWSPDLEPGERFVARVGGWSAYLTYAPVYPISLVFAPDDRVPDLPSCTPQQRDDLAGLFVDVLDRLDRLYDRPLPYMMWFDQAPFTADRGGPDPWLHLELVSPWRAAGVARWIAAAETACEEYFNPVVPEDLAATLRSLE